MKVKVSKVFANFINDMAKEGLIKIDHAEVKTFSQRGYAVNVSYDTFTAEQYGDMSYDNNGEPIFKAIVIVYPPEYYAMPMYISTAELTSEFNARHVSNADELKKMLKDMIEI